MKYYTLIPNPTLGIKIVFLAIGIIVICFGYSLYFNGDLGVSTYDAVALILSEKKVAKFQYCRIGSDFICTVIGYFLGAAVGVGRLNLCLYRG